MLRRSTVLCVAIFLAICLFSNVDGKKKAKAPKKETNRAPEKAREPSQLDKDHGVGNWNLAHLTYGNNPLHEAALEGGEKNIEEFPEEVSELAFIHQQSDSPNFSSLKIENHVPHNAYNKFHIFEHVYCKLVRKILDRVPGVFTDNRFSKWDYDDVEDYPTHNDLNDAGNNPLMLALFAGHKRIVEMLLDKGATVHSSNRAGNKPIMWASRHHDPYLVKLLLDRGADVNVADSHGFTPLHFAAHAGAVETCRLLLDRGAEVDAVTEIGHTAACSAAEFHKPDVLQLLIERGSNVKTLRDVNGNGPMDLCSGRAASQGYSGTPDEIRTVELLRDAGARYAEEKKEL